MDDLISRQQAIDAIEAEKIKHGNYLTSSYVGYEMAEKVVKQLPPIQPEPHEIGYDDCSNALLKMWMDNVLTDGEYYRIADKLNVKWGKVELPEPYKGVTE